MAKRTVFAPFEVKSAEVDGNVGKVSGYLSVYGVKDLAGDVVKKGAFTKDLKDNGDERPFLWQHMWHEPVGLLHLQDDDKGLHVDIDVDMDIPEGRRAFSGIKKKYCKGLSIGYDTLQDEIDREKQTRYLTELKLWEGSVVTFACLPIAQAEAKSLAMLLGTTSGLDALLGDDIKALEAFVAEIKAGRVLSAANLGRLQKAIEELQSIHASAVPQPETDDQKAAREASEAEAARVAAEQKTTPTPQGDEAFDPDFLSAFDAFHTTVKSAVQELR